MEFIKAPTFTVLVAEYLDDDEYRALQSFLAGDAEAGDVMPGTDLSPAEKRLLKAALDAELAQRAARRRPRRK